MKTKEIREREAVIIGDSIYRHRGSLEKEALLELILGEAQGVDFEEGTGIGLPPSILTSCQHCKESALYSLITFLKFGLCAKCHSKGFKTFIKDRGFNLPGPEGDVWLWDIRGGRKNDLDYVQKKVRC